VGESVATPLWGQVWKCNSHSQKWKNGLPKIQKTIWGVKSPCISAFFISMERFWSVDAQMASHRSFGHLQPKLWAKEGLGVKLSIWLPTTKSQESTSFRHRLKECNTVLESSQRELQLWFRPHPDSSSGWRVMSIQSPRTLTQDCRNPTLAKCGGEAQHLEKLEVWSPPGLPNV